MPNTEYCLNEIFLELKEKLKIAVDEQTFPNRIFYFLDESCVFEYDTKNKYLYCSYYHMWLYFGLSILREWTQCKILIKEYVEKYLEIRDVVPKIADTSQIEMIQKHFNTH